MNKPIYLGLSILKISKTVMHELLNDYIEPKYQGKTNLCYMDADSFIVNVKTDDISKDVSQFAEKGLDTSNYEIERPLPKS